MMRHILLGTVGLLLACGLAAAQTTQQPHGRSVAAGQAATAPAFTTPEQGFAALAEAAQHEDADALARVIGEQGRQLLRSGDPVDDAASLRRFAAAYAERHEIRLVSPGRAILDVGNDQWPLPIPMVLQRGAWRFDVAAGAREIADRRIGRNELDTIATLRAIVDAQDEYAAGAGRDGAFRTYARSFASSPGRRDGLYWEAAPNEPVSPLGPLVAQASAGGYRLGAHDAPQPFHGYFFRILDAQGVAAPGGAMSYVVDGRLIGGFGVVAWPAEWGASGIMTFLVNQAGDVFQQNLGRDTARIAAGIRAYDPGRGWQVVPQ